jgi:hypothetical protein
MFRLLHNLRFVVGWAVSVGVAASPLSGCRRSGPAVKKEFRDEFERKELGTNYFDTIGRYRIVNGRLNIEKAYNHPLWLRRPLPRDVEITLEVESKTSDGDIKVELFGDGRSFAMHRGSYRASGYVVCMGGWRNSKSFIARKDEHGKEGQAVVTRTDVKVKRGQRYRWRIVRQGKEIRWYVDGQLFLSFDDPLPLYGPRNKYFGFNNWQSDVYFDNLNIRPAR